MVGLGNPGDEHRATRHNVGFMVIEEMRRRTGAGRETRAGRALISRTSIEGTPVVLARPTTYMNRSGDAMASLLSLANAGAEDLLVVCDDIYLEFGNIRLRPRGTHGGHNGLRSIIAALGTSEFARVRVGVGPVPAETDHADFVLAPFARSERARLPEILTAAAECAEMAAAAGVPQAMNRFNRRSRPDEPNGASAS